MSLPSLPAATPRVKARNFIAMLASHQLVPGVLDASFEAILVFPRTQSRAGRNTAGDAGLDGDAEVRLRGWSDGPRVQPALNSRRSAGADGNAVVIPDGRRRVGVQYSGARRATIGRARGGRGRRRCPSPGLDDIAVEGRIPSSRFLLLQRAVGVVPLGTGSRSSCRSGVEHRKRHVRQRRDARRPMGRGAGRWSADSRCSAEAGGARGRQCTSRPRAARFRRRRRNKRRRGRRRAEGREAAARARSQMQ